MLNSVIKWTNLEKKITCGFQIEISGWRDKNAFCHSTPADLLEVHVTGILSLW